MLQELNNEDPNGYRNFLRVEHLDCILLKIFFPTTRFLIS